MRGVREVPPTLWGIIAYAVVLGVIVEAARIYKHTKLFAFLIAATAFVVFVPIVLLPMVELSSREWPDRLFRWHLIASAWILVLALVMIVMHWLGLRVP